MNVVIRRLMLVGGCLAVLTAQARFAFAQRGDDGTLAGERVGPQARYEAVWRMLQAGPAPEDACAFAALAPAGSLNALGYLALPKSEAYEKGFEEYRGMLLDAPDALVKLAADEPTTAARVSMSVRRLVAQQIRSLPPSLVAQHRRQIEPEAAKLLAEGREQRAAEPLQRLVRDYPLSDNAAAAYDLLGDLAFESGDFDLALHWWQRLADMLASDNSRSEGARVRAKRILALAFAARALEARREWEDFRTQYPGAHGTLASKSGPLADILHEWLTLRAGRTDEWPDDPWPTFAGNPARNGTIATALPAELWMDGPTWRVPLSTVDKDGVHPAERFLFQRHAPCHPIVTDGQVLVADARSVTSYDLESGKQLFQYRLVIGAKEEPAEKMPFGQRPRYTLSAGSGRVFARLGRVAQGPKEPGEAGDKFAPPAPSVLVCLDIATRPIPAGGRLLWQVDAKTPEGERAFFEGAPLVGEDRVWILVSDPKGMATRSCLACFDFQGKLRWMRELYEGTDFVEGRGDRGRHHLLTRSGQNIIAVLHTGAVVAVDAQTGAASWGVRYPRIGNERDTIPRELLPALACPGRVLVAPADANVVLCLDSDTGRVLWEHDTLSATQLLAVAQRTVLIALPQGVAGLDLDTGRTRWQQPSVGKLPSLGRGLLAGPWYLWPTHDPQLPFRAVHVVDGTPFFNEDGGYEPTQLRHLPPGNMAFGQGTLVIATPTEVVAFVGPKRLLPKVQAKASDGQPADRYRLALAQKLLGTDVGPGLKDEWQMLWLSRWKSQHTAGRDVISPVPLRSSTVVRDASRVPRMEPRLLWKATGRLMPVETCGADPDVVFDVSGDSVACRESRSGEVRWRARLRHMPVHWLGCLGETIVAAGPRGIDAFGRTDGVSRWSLSSPEPDSYQFHASGPTLESPLTELHDFACQSGYLTFLWDHRIAFVLDAATGKMLYRESCRDAALRPFEGERFQSGVELVPGAGAMGVRTRRVLGEVSLLASIDVTPAMRLVAGEPGRVAYLRQGDEQPRWTFTYPSKSMLCGEPPELLGQDELLLASFRTVLGSALVRLDAASGRAIWRFEPDATLDLDAAALDSDAIYVMKDAKLTALAVSNGRTLWTRSLPAHIPRWRIKATANGVLLHPGQTDIRPWFPLVPDLTLPWTLFHSTRSPREFPVLLVDRHTGEVRWDLRFDARGVPGCMQIQGGRLFVGTGEQIYALGAEIGNKP